MSLLDFTSAPPSSQPTHLSVKPTLTTTTVSFPPSLGPRPPIVMSPDSSWRNFEAESLASGSDGTSDPSVLTEGGHIVGGDRVTHLRLQSPPEVTVEFPPTKDGCLDPYTCERIAAIVKREMEGLEDDAYPGSEEGFSALLDRIMAALSAAFGWISFKIDKAQRIWHDDVEEWFQLASIIGGPTFLFLALRMVICGPSNRIWIERRLRAGIAQASQLRIFLEAGRLPARISERMSALGLRRREDPEPDIELGEVRPNV